MTPVLPQKRALHRTLVISTLSAFVLLGALGLGACGGGDDESGGASTSASSAAPPDTTAPATTTTISVEPLRILVSNDDGYAAEGIDVLVAALLELPDVEVTVVAPLENKSGTGGSTTPGTLTATEQQTAGGYPVTAVDGFPADSVNYGLDSVLADAPPHLVVAGSNFGQNLGVLTDVSGTVGAARAAGSRGIPALAVSQGLADAPDYPASVAAAVAWIVEHRAEILAFDPTSGDAAEVWNLNAPTCAVGEPRGVLEIDAATEQTGKEIVQDIDCTVTTDGTGGGTADIANDVEAFALGYITLSEVGTEPAAA